MGIKELLDKIQGLLPADAGPDLKSAITDAIAAASLMTDSLTAKNKENQLRREQKEALETKVADLEAENTKLKGAQNSDELNTYKSKAEQFDKLIAEQKQAKITKWKEAKAKLDDIKETDKRYNTVKEVSKKFRVAKEGEELSPEDVAYNLDTYDTLVLAGTLDVPKSDPEYGKSSGGETAPKTGAEAVLNIIKRGNK